MMLDNQLNESVSIENIRSFIRFWNSSYPIDYWWRKKYSIAFGSEAHKKQNMLDMRIEYEEDLLLKEELRANELKGDYKKGSGDWLKKRVSIVSEDRVDDLYDSLDINELGKEDVRKKAEGDTDKTITVKG